MNDQPDIFDLIEKYHQGLLSEEDRYLVEERMQKDVSFAEYVKINGLTNSLVYQSGFDMLREKMGTDLSLIDKKRKRKRRKWQIGAGIIIALSIVTGLVYYTNNSTKKNSPPPNKNTEELPSQNIENNSNESRQTGNKTKEGIIIPNEKTETQITKIENNISTIPFVTNSIAPQNNPNVIDNKEHLTLKENEVKVNNQFITDCNLSFEVIINATCKGESKGTIVVDQQSISGGTKPYRFQISNSEKESSSGVFQDLDKGNYIITLYDSKSCSNTKKVFVTEKNCSTKKSYSFNPSYGERWTEPSSAGKSGSFTIYNRAGITIFTGNLNGTIPAEWSGTNLSGNVVETGLYVCIITYADEQTEVIELSIIQ